MLNKIKKDAKVFFLLQFTTELIKNSASPLKNLKIQIEKSEIDRKKHVVEKLRKEQRPKKNLGNSLEKLKKILRPPIQKIPKIPERFDYLKPKTNKTLNLPKIDPIINDQVIEYIECNGPNQPIIVSGTIGTTKTDVILNKEEIDKIFQKFSQETNTPLKEGTFSAEVGNLKISGIISDIFDSKFIIKKKHISRSY